VDSTLADAFDDEDDSDDETDDRQRLVRSNTTPSSQVTPATTGNTSSTYAPTYQTPNSQAPSSRSGRVIGAGASDGVFANISARPERTETEKEEQPPVRFPCFA
jgi:hypothetical protein